METTDTANPHNPRVGDLKPRVVALGRAGIGLARSREIEFVRARTALQAIGELARPEGPALPPMLGVLLGPEIVRSEGVPSLVAALRTAAPHARVIAAGGPGPDAAVFDSVLPSEPTVLEVLEALMHENGAVGLIAADEHEPDLEAYDAPPVVSRVAADEPADLPSDEPSDEPSGEPIEAEPAEVFVTGAPTEHVQRAAPAEPSSPASSLGDAPMVEALLHRRDLAAAGVALIRRRIGRDDVHWLPSKPKSGAPGRMVPDEGTVQASVRLGSRTVGHLVLAHAHAADPNAGDLASRLADHAAWLTMWMTLARRQRSARRSSLTDPLTGAWNRRYFDGFLQRAIDRARRDRLTFTLLVFDIDEFKQYNDRFGHAAGDEILVETVRALKSSIRPTDKVCRIGGDEFVVIFWEPTGPRREGSTPPEDVSVLARRVQNAIRDQRFPKLGEEMQGALSVSGGLATFPWDGAEAQTLLERADSLAMESKRQGKNAITLGSGAARLSGSDPTASS